MTSYRVLSVVLLSACATTGALGIDPQSSSRGRIDLVPAVADDTARVTPQAIDPQLPSADRLARAIDARLGSEASVDVRLCVTPAGKLASAKLERSSSLAMFDDAVLADVQAWHFATQPGPATLQTCERTTIVYRPHR